MDVVKVQNFVRRIHSFAIEPVNFQAFLFAGRVLLSDATLLDGLLRPAGCRMTLPKTNNSTRLPLKEPRFCGTRSDLLYSPFPLSFAPIPLA